MHPDSESAGRVEIRPATAADAHAVAAIYNPHVLNTIVTFEEVPVPDVEMARRIDEISRQGTWLVHEIQGTVTGYAYAGPWKTRSAYRYTVESSIYVSDAYAGRGIGRRLYSALLDELRARGVHSVIGGIALPNEASVALHESLGFVKIGHFPAVGWKLARWIDVGYWVLPLRAGPPT